MNAKQMKVAEAITEADIGRDLARIDSNSMKILGLQPKDYIEIIGQKTTLGIAILQYPGSEEDSTIRIDGFMRKNCGVEPDDIVIIKKADVKPALHLKIAPSDLRFAVDRSLTKAIKERLIDHPFVVGDYLYIKSAGKTVAFRVIDSNPSGFTKVDQDTELEILSEPISPPTQILVRKVVVKPSETISLAEGESILNTTTTFTEGTQIANGLIVWISKKL